MMIPTPPVPYCAPVYVLGLRTQCPRSPRHSTARTSHRPHRLMSKSRTSEGSPLLFSNTPVGNICAVCIDGNAFIWIHEPKQYSLLHCQCVTENPPERKGCIIVPRRWTAMLTLFQQLHPCCWHKMREPEYYGGSLTWLIGSLLVLTNKLNILFGKSWISKKDWDPRRPGGCCLGFQQPWLLL